MRKFLLRRPLAFIGRLGVIAPRNGLKELSGGDVGVAANRSVTA
jgi:hypothetical protein